MSDPLTFQECCRRVLTSCKDAYARSYAAAALDYGLTGEEARLQALYILTNAGGWRGDEARETKAFLKEFSKRKNR